MDSSGCEKGCQRPLIFGFGSDKNDLKDFSFPPVKNENNKEMLKHAESKNECF